MYPLVLVVKPPRFKEKKKRRGMGHVFKKEEKRKRDMEENVQAGERNGEENEKIKNNKIILKNYI
jgi:hypothetical protein